MLKRLARRAILLVLLGICSLAAAADYSVDIRWIYYEDNCGREVDYDFSDGSVDPNGVVTIPEHAVVSPDLCFPNHHQWRPGFGDQQVSLSGGIYRMAIPQATDSSPETWGFSYLEPSCADAENLATEWAFGARIANFSNPGFGSPSASLYGYGVDLGSGCNPELDLQQARVFATWVTGHYGGVQYDNALVIEAYVTNEISGPGGYEWEWDIDGGGGVVLTGLDPATTVLDLWVEATNSGQTASFSYRVNSDDAGDWQLAVAHTLPAGVGTMYGIYKLVQTIAMDTWLDESGLVPVYRFWKAANGTHFYTVTESEKDKLISSYSHTYAYEGPVYYAYAEGQQPVGTRAVYRFWKGADGTHFYTMNDSERDKLISDYPHIYTYEGPVFYAYAEGEQPAGTQAVHRFWRVQGNTHFYTIKADEKDKLINSYSHVYTHEGAVWYAYE